jgi:hypothetical protein
MGSLSHQISIDQRSSSKKCYILKLIGLLLCLVVVIISVSLLVRYVPILINVIGRQSRSKTFDRNVTIMSTTITTTTIELVHMVREDDVIPKVCLPFFSGVNCEVNIDECASNSCQNNATCIDGINNFTCSCQPGFTGRFCETNINECEV